MFVFISHFTVPESDRSELERHVRERSRLVDGFPGFLYLQLLSPQHGGATHAFLTAWENRAALECVHAQRGAGLLVLRARAGLR